jgi:hypothetical protein
LWPVIIIGLRNSTGKKYELPGEVAAHSTGRVTFIFSTFNLSYEMKLAHFDTLAQVLATVLKGTVPQKSM